MRRDLKFALDQIEDAKKARGESALRRKAAGSAGVFSGADGPCRMCRRTLLHERRDVRADGADREIHDRSGRDRDGERVAVWIGAYAFTSNLDRMFRVIEKLEAGTIGINDGVPTTRNAPFGGMKHSGWGRELGSEGLDAFLETKHVSIGIVDE